MKKTYLSIFCLFLSLILINPAEAQDSFSKLITDFKNVPVKYRSAPFWVWNYKVTKPEIDRMLSDFKEKGFGGVFVHPRYGMITEYLSDEWFELYSYTVEAGRKLGLDIWLYDENAYPSGFAGGHLPNEMPESYTQGQGLEPFEMNSLPEDYDQYFLILYEEKGVFHDITSTATKYKNQNGHFIAYKKTFYPDNVQPSRAWYAGFSNVDLLLPGVTEKFIEITMAGYEKRFSHEFGKQIPGIFTDEVNIRSSGGVRWTPDLFDVFMKRYGYDLKTNLPSLHTQTGNWKKVRYDYSKLLSDLFVERWAKPWYNYCTENNLIWTGHYWEQSWPGITQVPDNMAMNAWQHMPGVDMLSNTFDEERSSGMFGNVRVVKEAKSAANQLGRERLLCEAYGGGGWVMNFKDFKRHSDWLNVMGVNFMNQHLSHMSFLGVRKYDWPPMFCPMAPWWEDYKVLNEYLARMSLVTTLGKLTNDILVFEPTSTTWMYAQHTGDGGNEKAQTIANAFQKLTVSLEKDQIEYDLGCESIIIENGKTRNDRFIVGECSYKTVVIPELVENMDSQCFKLLKTFVEQGGQLITFSQPNRIDGDISDDIIYFFTDNRIIKAVSYKDKTILSHLKNENINFIKQDGGNVFHQRRQYIDGELLLLVNSSVNESSFVTIEMNGRSVVEMNTFNGDIYTYPSESKGNKVTFSAEVAPAGSLLFFVNNKAEENSKLKPAISYNDLKEINPTTKTSSKRIKDNALLINYLDLIQGKDTSKQMYALDANFDVFRKAGFKDGNPFFRAIQFKQEIVNKDVSKAPGFSTVYHFEILDDLKSFSSMKLLCERARLYTIEVNGHVVRPGNQTLIDKDFNLLPIGEYLHTGKNKIVISINSFNVEAEIEPVYILGDFSVIVKDNKWVISGNKQNNVFGSNKDMGAPFYPWETSYTKTYNLNKEKGTYILSVPDWKGSLVQVWVNNVKAGIIFTDPYQLDITDYIKSGENNIDVRVIGNMDNFFGPHYNRSQGMTPPWDWQKHSGSNNADKYILSDYGLFNDYKLLYTQ